VQVGSQVHASYWLGGAPGLPKMQQSGPLVDVVGTWGPDENVDANPQSVWLLPV
jgi:hypothetical protein